MYGILTRTYRHIIQRLPLSRPIPPARRQQVAPLRWAVPLPVRASTARPLVVDGWMVDVGLRGRGKPDLMPAMNPDFDRLLAEATVIAADARLRLPSGRLVAAEPPGLFPAGEVARWAFPQTVAPGEYAVEVLAEEAAVLGARVVVRPEPVSEWLPAQRGGEDYVYPVDGATGAFGSVEVFEALTDDEAREDLIADLSFDGDEPYSVYHHEATGTNLVAISLDADGRYRSWVGYTADAEVACFLTDFGDLEHRPGDR